MDSYNTKCPHCMLRGCVCGFMYRNWEAREIEDVINTLQNILKNPSFSSRVPLDYPRVVEGNILFAKPMTLWERWKSRKKRKALDTLWTNAQFRFRPDCPLVTSGQCTELQGVIRVSSWDVDGYGNYCYTITSRGLDGKEITFGTSTYDRTGGPHPDVHPKYILIRD